MTVVEFLDLDGKTCVACADERVTYGSVRTFDIYRKLHKLGKSSAVGFSGHGPYGGEILDTADSTVNQQADMSTALECLEKSYSRIRGRKVSDLLLQRFYIGPEEVKNLPGGSDIAKEVVEQLKSGNIFDVVFAIGGYDERRKAIRIYTVGYPGHSCLQEKYVVVGSGSDRAHRDIGDSLQGVSAEERSRIEPYRGVRILMEATQSAWRNEGVGGVTQIMLIGDDRVVEIGRSESNLLNNALYCERREVLKKPYVDSLFQRAVHDNASAQELLKELQDMVPPEELARLFWTQSLHV